MTDNASAFQLIGRYFAAINSDDWDEVRQVYAEDGVYQGSGGKPQQGIDSIVAYYPKLFSAWSVHTDTPTTITIGSGTARADVVFTGTTRDGRDVRFDAVDDFVLRGERLASVTTTYDLDAVRALMSGQ
ncbi:hypothetical protein BH09ACT6_BH09ACT6_05610 [soil metagenome]